MKAARVTARGAAALLTGVLALGGTLLAAPPRTARGPDRPSPERDDPAAPPTREEMREAMEQVMMVRMKRVLRLTPAQEGKVIPRVQTLLEARRDYAGKRRAALLRLRALSMDDGASDEPIGQALREVQAIEGRFREKQEGLRDAINAELTPRQQARLLFFEERFRRMMQRKLQGGGPPPPLNGRRLGQQGPRKGGGPEDPFGDLGEPEDDE